MIPYFVCFGKYGLEAIINLEEEDNAFQEYVFNKLRDPKAPEPISRLNTMILHMKNHEYKELEGWAFKSDMNTMEVWDAFADDYDNMITKVKDVGFNIME